MSLMSLGIKMNALQKWIKERRFTTKEQVKTAALELNISAYADSENKGTMQQKSTTIIIANREI